jgi:hypothetical protein
VRYEHRWGRGAFIAAECGCTDPAKVWQTLAVFDAFVLLPFGAPGTAYRFTRGVHFEKLVDLLTAEAMAAAIELDERLCGRPSV